MADELLASLNFDFNVATVELGKIEPVKHNPNVPDVTEEQLSQICNLLYVDPPHLALLQATAFYFLNAANRDTSSNLNFAEILSKLVYDDSVDDNIRSFSALAIAHFTNDNAKNAEEVSKYLSAEKVVELLDSVNNADILLNIARSMASITTAYEKFQTDLIAANAGPAIIKLLHHDNILIICLATRALSAIAENLQLKQLIYGACNERLREIIFNNEGTDNDSARLRNECLQTLHDITEENEKDLIHFAEHNGIQDLLKLVKCDTDQNKQDAFRFLISLASIENVRVIFYEKNLVAPLVETSQIESLDPIFRGCVLTLLGYLAINEKIMEYLFKYYKSYFELLSNDSAEIKLGTTIIISNIARREDFCKSIVAEPGVIKFVEFLADGQDIDTRLRHLSLSTLRNLAIPGPLKTIVGNLENIFPATIACLEDTSAHVEFAAVMLLKVLLSGEDSLKDKFLAAKGLEGILELFAKELDENQQRIQFEAARLVANLADAQAKYRDIVVNAGGLSAINYLLRNNFALLHVEALRVFRETVKRAIYRQKMLEAECLKYLYAIITSPEKNIRAETVTIICQMLQEEGAKKQMIELDYKVQLTKLIQMEGENDPAAQLAKKILETINQ